MPGVRNLTRGEAIARYVNAQVGNRLIENMVVPLGIVATDLNTGQGVVFRRLPLIPLGAGFSPLAAYRLEHASEALNERRSSPHRR